MIMKCICRCPSPVQTHSPVWSFFFCCFFFFSKPFGDNHILTYTQLKWTAQSLYRLLARPSFPFDEWNQNSWSWAAFGAGQEWVVRESLHFGFVCIRPPLFSVSTELVRVSSHPEMTSQLVSIIKSYSSSKRKLYRWGCSLFNSTQFFSSIEQRLEPPFFPLVGAQKAWLLCAPGLFPHIWLLPFVGIIISNPFGV